MTIRFHENPARLSHAALLSYVDDMEGWLREFMVEPNSAAAIQRTFRLTPGESRALVLLSDGRIKSRQKLLAVMRPEVGPMPDIKIVDVRICTLRAKMKPHGIKIETIRGVGYVLTEGGDVIAKAISG